MRPSTVRSSSLLMQACALFVAAPAHAATAADPIYDFSLDEAEGRSSDAERHFTLSLRPREAGRAVALRLAPAEANRWHIMPPEARDAGGRLYACRSPDAAADPAAALRDGRTAEALPALPARDAADELVLICDLLQA